MDLDRLTLGERVLGAGALLLVAVSFLHWLGGRISSIEVGGKAIPARQLSSASELRFAHSAWGYAVTALAVVLAAGLLVYVVALTVISDERLQRIPTRRAAAVVAWLGVITFLLVLAKVSLGADLGTSSFGLPSTSGVAIHVSFTKTREVGAYVGLAAGAAVGAGGILNLRET